MSKEVHGLTPTQIEDFRAKHGALKVAELFDSEGNSQGFVVLGKPSAAVIGQFEKFIDKSQNNQDVANVFLSNYQKTKQY